MEDDKEMVPGNEEGLKTDTESSITFENEAEAEKHFQIVKSRLLNVSGWKEFSKAGSSGFQLVDNAGNEVSRTAQEGDYFSINIPAPSTDSGEGYDWVYIEKIEEQNEPLQQMETTAIKVRPSGNPHNNSHDVSHFFEGKASSTFLVKREGCTITASVHGRNEAPNTESEDFSDKIRNAVVAFGAMLGFSKAQWKSLVEGLIEK